VLPLEKFRAGTQPENGAGSWYHQTSGAEIGVTQIGVTVCPAAITVVPPLPPGVDWTVVSDRAVSG
jgi:hypothetical protein